MALKIFSISIALFSPTTLSRNAALAAPSSSLNNICNFT
ncbi:NADH dehydrogenase subunit N [Rickettsia rickettsii str. Arizona]|uniref:NADH dehydrogenase subunit N n=1 Tax=Rickettsia rickettsii (strain Sheila Smith) TaxID=392021 RepID=A0A0H3AXT8_RICRS|nr:NADH dehydrogenase subunit N [Rickettsia rickettsii str. 'Sheila Smith']AFB23738.1 NADH dehydrogenase subunit N [Rickettsia rickettsii str. Colombia]AFB25086.1 NADH dehydrogenase subunit N [Rickettsia rickettsii str. Arizona]AFB27767.1 NADH dehydrogenase subunit N [Rickettsia rickettsii str. Hino]AFB29093.1 NADH dehydrogenase subunit N [Rickettsia rickettsii str. Hlp\